MNITHLRYFIEIAKCHSISQASRHLFVTQPALSLALKKLEQELDQQLFFRTEHGLQATQAGKLLYNEGQQLLDQWDELTHRIQSLSNTEEKIDIRLGITSLFAIQFVDEIARFQQAYPHVNLITKQDGSHMLQQLLAKGQLDLALVSYPNYLPDKITIDSIHNSRKGYHVYVVVPTENPLADKATLTFAELKDQRFSSLTNNYVLGLLLKEKAQDLGFTPNVIAYHSSLQVLLHSLKSSQTICLMAIEYQILGPQEGLAWIPLDDDQNYFPIGLALNKEGQNLPEVHDFIAIIQNH